MEELGTNSLGSIVPLGTIVSLSFYLIVGAYIIYSVILFYHWKNYGTDVKVTTVTLVTYLATTVPLIVIMSVLTVMI
jgi:hypothetical protein